MRRVARPRARDDQAVVGVVAAILVVGAMVTFVGVMRATWLPAWQEEAEAAHAAEARSALAGWADAAEDHVARRLDGRAFARELAVGAPGVSVPFVGSAQAAGGSVRLDPAPSLTVHLGGSPLATATGAVVMALEPGAYAPSTMRYVLGAFEVNQSGGAWADLRSLLAAQRAPGGKVSLAVQAMSLTGGSQSVATSGDVQLAGTVNRSASTTHGAGTVRLLATGVAGDAWAAAAERALQAAGLTGTRVATCPASPAGSDRWCLDSDAGATTLDLTLYEVASDWTLVAGAVRVEVRA